MVVVLLQGTVVSCTVCEKALVPCLLQMLKGKGGSRWWWPPAFKELVSVLNRIPCIVRSDSNTQKMAKLLIRLRKLARANFQKASCSWIWPTVLSKASCGLWNTWSMIWPWESCFAHAEAVGLHSVWPRSINGLRPQTPSGANIYVSWTLGFSVCNSPSRK